MRSISLDHDVIDDLPIEDLIDMPQGLLDEDQGLLDEALLDKTWQVDPLEHKERIPSISIKSLKA